MWWTVRTMTAIGTASFFAISTAANADLILPHEDGRGPDWAKLSFIAAILFILTMGWIIGTLFWQIHTLTNKRRVSQRLLRLQSRGQELCDIINTHRNADEIATNEWDRNFKKWLRELCTYVSEHVSPVAANELEIEPNIAPSILTINGEEATERRRLLFYGLYHRQKRLDTIIKEFDKQQR